MRSVAARYAAAFAAMCAAACAGDAPHPATDRATTAIVTDSALPSADVALPTSWDIDTIARGLEVPWGVATVPGGRLFVTERPGRIRVIDSIGLDSTPWATLDVYALDPSWGPETGLMGIAVAPDFATSAHVYIMATFRRPASGPKRPLAERVWSRLGGGDDAAALPFVSRIIRFTERDGRGVDPIIIVDDLPANHFHAGGGLAFGPDGMLFASVGDGILPAFAQDARSPLGKILRLTPSGDAPADNPELGSLVWARGLPG